MRDMVESPSRSFGADNCNAVALPFVCLLYRALLAWSKIAYQVKTAIPVGETAEPNCCGGYYNTRGRKRIVAKPKAGCSIFMDTQRFILSKLTSKKTMSNAG